MFFRPRPVLRDTGDGALASRAGWLCAWDLSKSYKGMRVVDRVSISVGKGEVVGVLGPNGAGKTTVFYMISGLVQPDSGMIELEGRDVTGMPMFQRARHGIGYLPQEASILRDLSVENNIRAILQIWIPNRDEQEFALEQLLDEFGIKHVRHASSLTVSGGERRRCEIARALACKPVFILLDEPFAGIDPIAVEDIQHLVRQLSQKGIGVLITDHNVRETLGLIDRGYILYGGRVIAEGPPSALVGDQNVRDVYLGNSFGLTD